MGTVQDKFRKLNRLVPVQVQGIEVCAKKCSPRELREFAAAVKDDDDNTKLAEVMANLFYEPDGTRAFDPAFLVDEMPTEVLRELVLAWKTVNGISDNDKKKES